MNARVAPPPITIENYFGSEAALSEYRLNAGGLLETVNLVLGLAWSDGIELEINPHTGTLISGNGHGGFRAASVDVGALHSKHRTGQAVDVYDPHRHLAAWAMQNSRLLQNYGLAIERPEWTPTWVHFQNVPPSSGVFAFIPNSSPPLAPPVEVDAA